MVLSNKVEKLSYFELHNPSGVYYFHSGTTTTPTTPPPTKTSMVSPPLIRDMKQRAAGLITKS